MVPAQQTVTGHRFATFEHLAWVFGRNAEKLTADFVPLRADPELVETFRKRYRSMTDLPLIGLSWGSKSHTKDVPDFPQWSRFIAQTPATFVSLQYGQIKPALRRLRNGNDARLIYDESVDQMVDMDRFAAQIASLDVVVTISNTAAHLSGALGMPTIFLIDDNFQTTWPVTGDRTPWYPKGLVVHKDGRDWSAVLDEVRRSLSGPAFKKQRPASAGGAELRIASQAFDNGKDRALQSGTKLTFRTRYQTLRKSLRHLFGRPENEIDGWWTRCRPQ